eukprot:m.86709 g.86709  ORF g.86709 m.86709 type:complete len:547 (+) comp15104_c0_seq2:109-1749(+)
MRATTSAAAIFVVVVAATLAVASAKDLFASSANVQKLFGIEKNLGMVIKAYVKAEQQRLDELLRKAEEFSGVVAPQSDLVMQPSDGFNVISRLIDGMHMLESSETAASSIVHAFRDQMDGLLPSREDLQGVAMAFLRLQRTYDVPVTRLLSNGRPQDYLYVGQVAHDQGDWACARLWLMQGLAVANVSTDRAEILIDLYDYLAYAELQLGNMTEALRYSQLLLALSPFHERILRNVQEYRRALQEQAAENQTQGQGQQQQQVQNQVKQQQVQQELQPNYDADNLLGRNATEMENFRRLCRMEQLYKSPHPLTCRLYHYNKPHLFYRPFKVEHVRVGVVNMKVFRDFATPKECQTLKDVAINRLKRAVAFQANVFQPTDFRISTVHWLGEEEHPLVSTINNRIQEATNLNISSAESLQISNYGMGGHYEPHLDHHGERSDDMPDGDRLATFMIYLSPVSAGGATAFPRLGVRVPPSAGDAAFWHNIDLRDNSGNSNTLHGGCPVLAGSKWVANKWFPEGGNTQCPIFKQHSERYPWSPRKAKATPAA